MKWDRIVGVCAIVAIAVMTGLALTADDEAQIPQVVAPPPSETFAEGSGPDSLAPATDPIASSDPTTPSSEPTTPEESSPPETAPQTSPTSEPTESAPGAPLTQPDSPVDRPALTVRVVNAGAPSGSASTATQAVSAAGFTAASPGDLDLEPFSFVMYEPLTSSASAAATEIAGLLGIDTAAVIPRADQAQWNATATPDTDIIVVLGQDRR